MNLIGYASTGIKWGREDKKKSGRAATLYMVCKMAKLLKMFDYTCGFQTTQNFSIYFFLSLHSVNSKYLLLKTIPCKHNLVQISVNNLILKTILPEPNRSRIFGYSLLVAFLNTSPFTNRYSVKKFWFSWDTPILPTKA